MKTALKILGGLIVLILIAIVTIPMFVDVDKYRPQIVAAANQQLNGTLELGKLSLSLWGKIHVGVDGLKVSDGDKKEVLSVKDASFDMPYLSVLEGAPLVTVSLKQPDITVTKDKDGKLNVMTLAKVTAKDVPATPGTAATPAPVKAASDGKIELPSIAVNAHFGISIENAKLTYKDQVMALSNTIDNLNLRVKDFSLSRKTELELWADLKTQMGSDLSVEGPLKLTADLSPEISGGEFKSATVNANFSADDLTIQKGVLFIKKKGVPMNFKFSGTLDQTSLKLKEASVRFHNAEVVVNGVFQKETGMDFHFEAKPVDLKSWSELIPMLKEYELEGKLGLKGDAKGKPEALNYDAKLTIENFAAKGPNLKAKPLINGSIEVSTDKIDRFFIDLKGPGNEVTLDGKLISFSKPQITFAVSSPKGMDLDQWIEFPKTDAVAASKAADAKAKPPAGSVPKEQVDMDAMLDPLRKNEMAKAMSIDGSVAIAFIKAKGIRIDDIALKLQFKNLIAAISGLRMKMFDGSLAGSFSTDLKPKEPLYNMNVVLNGLDMQKAVESQFQSFKDTLIGKLSASMQGGGASFNADTAKKRLQMKGDFKIANAAFQTLNISKMVNDALTGSLGKIADKIPMLKGKNLHVSPSGGSKYDLISSNFTVSNGVLDAPNFVAKATPRQGIDIKGSTKMGLIDESLDAKWELTDTYHTTGADQLSVNVAGKEIPNFLAKGEKDPVILPITIGCKWTAPCPNYSQVTEYLAGVATGRLTHATQDVVKQKAQDAGKNLLKGGLKGLFGH